MTFNFVGYFSLHSLDLAGYGKLGNFLAAAHRNNDYESTVLFFICAIIVGAFFWFLIDNTKKRLEYSPINLLMGCLIIILMGTYFSSFENREQMIHRWTRYCIVPSVIVIWMIILQAEASIDKWRKGFCLFLLFWLLGVGIYHKWPSNNRLYSNPVAWKNLASEWSQDSKKPLFGLPNNRVIKLAEPL